MKNLYKILAIAFVLSINLISSNAQPKTIMYDGDTLWVHPTDNSGSKEWGGYGTNISHGNGAGSSSNGYQNTAAIVSELGAGNYAAYLCDTLNAYGYDDWYLPALEELNTIRAVKDQISGISLSNYWTSVEFNTNDGWSLDFNESSGAGFI